MDSGQAQLYAVPTLTYTTPTPKEVITDRRRQDTSSDGPQLTHNISSHRAHQIPTQSFFQPSASSEDNRLRGDSSTPRPPTTASMSGSEIPKTEGMGQPQGVWSTPVSQGMRPRPATIHEGFSYCMGEGYDGLPAWDSSTLPLQQTPSDISSRPISVHQDFYPPTSMESSKPSSRSLPWDALV